jgi:serine O-acetyltransferase
VKILIKSKDDLKEYIEIDRIASKRKKRKYISLSDVIWRYQVHMRKAEYYTNCGKGVIDKINLRYHKLIYNILGIILNYSIPLNTCGKGLYLTHIGTIVISQYSRLGDFCTINVDVCIGKQPYGDKKAATLGNNIYISPGVKIFGDIKLANGIAIGANSVVY